MAPVLSHRPRERIQVDLMDFRHQPAIYRGQEMKWIINFVDHYSRRCHLKALPSKGAKDIVEAFKQFIVNYGTPHCFHTDNGSEFISAEILQFYKKFGVAIVHGRTQSLGVVKSHSRRVKEKLRKMITEDGLNGVENPEANWPEYLEDVQHILNSTKIRGFKRTPLEVYYSETGEFSVARHSVLHYLCRKDANGVHFLDPMQIRETDELDNSGAKIGQPSESESEEEEEGDDDGFDYNSKTFLLDAVLPRDQSGHDSHNLTAKAKQTIDDDYIFKPSPSPQEFLDAEQVAVNKTLKKQKGR